MTAKYQHDDIAKIAYRSWLDRGQPDGSPEIDWYFALSVVTNPDEIRPAPFGNFASDDTADETDEWSVASAADKQSLNDESVNEQSVDSSAEGQAVRHGGMQDEGMRNDTDSDNAEVTRRSEQFDISQQASSLQRSRKKAAADGKYKQSERAR